MRDLERPLPPLAAARAVFDLGLEGMLWSRRTLLMGLLVGFPALLALVYRVTLAAGVAPHVAPRELLGWVVVKYWVAHVLPLAALFYASALVADEVEGRTLPYLLTRPVARAPLLAGKFAAYLLTTAALALPAATLTFLLLATTRGWSGLSAWSPLLFRDLGVMVLALAAYGALFTLMGVLLRRPLVPGLLFVFVWEWAYYLPGHLPRLTLTAYLRSLLSHPVAQEGLGGLFLQTFPAATCLATLAVACAAWLLAAFWIFSHKEYVLSQ